MQLRDFHIGVIFLLLFCVLNYGYSQNLVLNPSFENFINCPVKLGNLEQDVEDWNMPTLGSTDYFNGCSKAMGTPKNFNGQQPADFGVGYVGLYMFAPNDYREYIEASLTSTLKKGERYTISFYVSLAERSDFAVKEFGIRFSEFQVQVETSRVLSSMHFSKLKGDTSNQLEIKYSKFYSDEIEWIKLKQEFVANGTENYLIIGNFKNNKRTQKFQTKRKITKGSYYYLDMVSVYKIDSEDMIVTAENKNEFKIDSVHVFRDIHFDFNRSIPRNLHQRELNSLVAYMKEHTKLKIAITGHTDNIGSNTFNKILSLKRAEEVANFLINNGIDESRIEYVGLGSVKPIADNTTDAGRLLNRRVEFILIN
jgi:outer membrane protein OmpA-like peptidoglycan-associated protein